MKVTTGALRLGLMVATACIAMAGCSRGDGSGQAAASSGAGGAAGLASDRAYAGERGGGGYAEREDRAPVPLFHGEPMWSENRAHSAKENAEYHFERAGPDLGAKTLDDFLTKVHHFGDHPPAGTLKLARANGDKLFYDPKANLFAVFTRQGAPRTVFKPSDGMAYWTEQKTREQARASGGDYGGSRSGYGGERSGRGGGSGDQGE